MVAKQMLISAVLPQRCVARLNFFTHGDTSMSLYYVDREKVTIAVFYKDENFLCRIVVLTGFELNMKFNGVYQTIINSLVSDHPWFTEKWSPTGGGRLWKNVTK